MDKSDPFKLLAIDGDTEILAIISAALKEDGLEILTAEDPTIGFETFLRVRPKIVLLDSVIPSIEGMELLERIIRVDPGASVILIAAHYSPEKDKARMREGK